jgi:outer membrane protein OmpA-like peptidoglycan-associated protein
MRSTLLIGSVAALGLLGTSCATKGYVTRTITPVEQRVSAAESKNADQDNRIAAADKEIDELGAELSKTREQLGNRINETDAKATAAGQAAQQAGQRADGAQKSADGARTLAQQGNDKADAVKRDVDRTITVIDGINKYQMMKSETVLFPLSQFKLSAESRAQLDDIARAAAGQERFMIEVQGFTDKTGSADTNERLSRQRADEVTRYLVNEHKIPVRSISSIGSGYASPVGDDSTRDGRAMNRRVEVRLFVPEIGSAAKAVAAQTAQR